MSVSLMIDGKPHSANEGECLASVLMRQQPPVFRQHPVDGSPRTAFCMMGVCFECQVEIDGIRGQQACLVVVRDGMTVRRGRM
ncbi:(2Fe-2S)-binding protein [Nioella sp.]|uniref:(2Fe-2S)-binding protein n=1 Tax=Nioella sp. TaxID=1912091 RepID=UPI003A86F80A